MGKKFEKKATKVEIISKKLIFLNFPPPQKKLCIFMHFLCIFNAFFMYFLCIFMYLNYVNYVKIM